MASPPFQPSITTLFGGAMLLVGLVVFAVSARYVWRATSVYRATEISDTGDSVAGALVRVSGTVAHHDDALVAPFSETKCVALRYQIEERRLNLLNPIPWYVTIHEATGAVEFTVETSAGSVPIIKPARTVTLTKRIIATNRVDEARLEQIQTFERDHDDIPETTVWRDPPAVLQPLFRFLALGSRRYSEQRAETGDSVTVVGRSTEDATGIDPLVVSDRPPGKTVFRMAKSSMLGLFVSFTGILLGVFLLVVL
jgi:hypothetical protein